MFGLSRQTMLLGVAAVLAIAAFADYRLRDGGADDALAPARRGPSATMARVVRAPAGLSLGTPGVRPHPLQQLRLAGLGETVSRPLFEPTRRGITPPPQPPSMPMTPFPSMPSGGEISSARLLGTITGDGRAFAVLVVQGKDKPVRVQVGDTVETWMVDVIGLEEVELVKDGRREVVRMSRKPR